MSNVILFYESLYMTLFLFCILLSLPFYPHFLFWHQFSSVAQSCLTLCNPMNRSMPGLPVHHQLPEFTQTHVHRVSDASVVPFSSCPQSLPASESFPMRQLFSWGDQSTTSSFLPKNTQGWSPLEWTGWISLQSKGLLRVFSNCRVAPKFNDHLVLGDKHLDSSFLGRWRGRDGIYMRSTGACPRAP